jgi:hypothetical protein
MKRRKFWVGLTLAYACSAMVGCETLNHGLGSSKDKQAEKEKQKEKDAEAASEVNEVKSNAPKGFFKSSQLSGAMSDEGRDIERSLGIH